LYIYVEMEVVDKAAARERAAQRNAEVTANKKIEQMTDQEHDELRSGLQSIMADLDNAVANLGGTKKKT
jgi:multidrug resistance efflux pump